MSKNKVMIIEDEADIRELIRHNLSREGFDVACMGDGEKGLKALKERPVDLVILDLMLPGMHGLDVCRQMRADEKLRRVGVLMVTARDEEADIVTGLELGAAGHRIPFVTPLFDGHQGLLSRRVRL